MIFTLFIALIAAACVSATVPMALFLVNLRQYKAPQRGPDKRSISVLIPARNEERNIGSCLNSVLQSRDVSIEVLVLDDGSIDATAAIVERAADLDHRVRLLAGIELPHGWNGKQHACWRLARAAKFDCLLFLDADVRLTPDAISRCAAQMRDDSIALLSGFPRQITVGWMEKLLLPLIHFILLSFLPMGRMRRSTAEAFAAGCGQFFLAEREAYFACGGHSGIRETRHDGLKLPMLFRRYGFRTDIYDLTELAEVRMYDSARAVWMGLAKNATEGIATPARIMPFTLLLLLGQVLPTLVLLAWLVLYNESAAIHSSRFLGAVVVTAFVASFVPRLLAVRRFRQPLISAVLHPVGVVMMLAVQWYAFVRERLGKPVSWRARSYSSETGEEVS